MTYLDNIDYQAENGPLVGACSVPGTPIAAAITTALAETAALALLRNTDVKAIKDGGRIIIPQYLRLICRVAPASATSLELAISQDDIDRYASGGSQIAAGNSRSDQLDSTAFPVKGRLDVGALVLNAASARRRWITRKTLKNAIPVVGDEFLITFDNITPAQLQLLTGAAAQTFTHGTDPVSLIPGGIDGSGKASGSHSLSFHIWEPGNAVTAGQYDVEAGWIEKT